MYSNSSGKRSCGNRLPVKTTAPPITPSTSGNCSLSGASKRALRVSAMRVTAASTVSLSNNSSAFSSRARARLWWKSCMVFLKRGMKPPLSAISGLMAGRWICATAPSARGGRGRAAGPAAGQAEFALDLFGQPGGHQFVGAPQQRGRLRVADLAQVDDAHPLGARQIRRGDDAGTVGQFEKALVLDLEADAVGSAVHAGDGEHFRGDGKHQIAFPFDVFGGAGQGAAKCQGEFEVHAAIMPAGAIAVHAHGLRPRDAGLMESPQALGRKGAIIFTIATGFWCNKPAISPTLKHRRQRGAWRQIRPAAWTAVMKSPSSAVGNHGIIGPILQAALRGGRQTV